MTEREIFVAALNLTDQAERQAFLDRACGEDAGVRARVEALLAVHSRKRLQQVEPEGQSRALLGILCHLQPSRSRYRIPRSAALSSLKGWPPLGR